MRLLAAKVTQVTRQKRLEQLHVVAPGLARYQVLGTVLLLRIKRMFDLPKKLILQLKTLVVGFHRLNRLYDC